jgi:hypothetical protein
MAQAWHKQREQLVLAPSAEATWWRASKYKLDNEDAPAFIEAASNAMWERFEPFGSYQATSGVREVEAGPHLMFLQLKHIMEKQQDLFHKALMLFAKKYGLLGAFEQDYLERPVFPEGKFLVAPEAGIDNEGRLQRFDPATEGRDVIREAQYRKGWRVPWSKAEAVSSIAVPSEMRFITKNPHLNSEWWPTDTPRQLVPWESIKEDFGALLILDLTTFKGFSVLCTREPLRRWDHNLSFFPSGDTPVEQLVSNEEFVSFNSFLQEASPHAVIGKDGNLERSWYCHSLIQAMYVMLYLDLTGGNSIKKCQSRGCPNYFRAGPQTKSIYCSDQCANRASTRMGRGQEP